MIKYIDKTDCIFDRETGDYIPKTPGNVEYQTFLAWVDDGNTPVPEQPGPEYVLNGDVWEIDTSLDKTIRINERYQALRETDIGLFKMIWALFDVGRTKGLWVVADFPTDLVTLAQQWKTKLDEIEAIENEP